MAGCIGTGDDPGVRAPDSRERNPGVVFHLADMANFRLGSSFDAVICIGRSIGYVRTISGLNRTVQTIADHTAPGGVVVIHGWLSPHQWQAGRRTADIVDGPDVHIARFTVSSRIDDLSIMDMHHMVATLSGVEYFVERHEMGLFTPEQYRTALTQAGLTAVDDLPNEAERGFYLGVQVS